MNDSFSAIYYFVFVGFSRQYLTLQTFLNPDCFAAENDLWKLLKRNPFQPDEQVMDNSNPEQKTLIACVETLKDYFINGQDMIPARCQFLFIQ